MRICLVAHGYPPEERTGVETYTAQLAASFAEAGHDVEVFAACPDAELPDLALRRAVVSTGSAIYGVTRVATNSTPTNPEEVLDPPGVAARFASFLERERPEVVHFQHVIKLGLGLVEVATKAGLPTLYTHHDYYGCCHRYTFLRPDLKVCQRPNDSEACARCDVALGLLNSVEGLGDYQMGVEASALAPEVASKLAGLLDGDAVRAGGLAEGELEVAVERRQSLDKHRLEVFSTLGRRLSPSKFLAEKLESTGMGPVEHLACGIDCEDLLPLRITNPVSAPAPGKPLRILYIGSLVKQKGVDVLLEAFHRIQKAPGAKQRPRVELTLRGYASDSNWVSELSSRALEVGARFGGGYQRAELPEILAWADVVVVPSTWFENYPIVIREALAAGRPVIASRLGALSESVVDGKDGLLFEAGNSTDLARALGRLLDEPYLLEKLVSGIGDVHSVKDQVEQLLRLYGEQLAAVKGENFETAPVHMRAFLQRCSELEQTPSRELFRGVLGGLGRLADGLGVRSEDSQVSVVLERAFSTGDEAQSLLRDFKRESSWLRGALEGATNSAAKQSERMTWLEESLRDRDATITSIGAERDEQRQSRVGLEGKVEWLEATIAGQEETRAANDGELLWMRETITGLTEERDYLASKLASLEEQVSVLQGELVESKAGHIALEQLLRERLHEVAESGLLALRGQEQMVTAGLVPLFEALEEASGVRADPSLTTIEGGLDNLVAAVQEGLVNLQHVEAKLMTRVHEMQALSEEASQPMVRLLLARTAVGSRLSRWKQGEFIPKNRGTQ